MKLINGCSNSDRFCNHWHPFYKLPTGNRRKMNNSCFNVEAIFFSIILVTDTKSHFHRYVSKCLYENKYFI